MGHGKETPRQKMIGMMYLVLTALLALNVSKSVLDAFVMVDQGLNKTVDNFSSKSAILYAALDAAAAENKAAAGEWAEKAKKVQTLSDELSRAIDEVKVRLIKVADKIEISADTVRNYELNAKSNTDIGGQVMIVEGGGKDLKQKIIDFREQLKEIVGDSAIELRKQLDKSLNTDDPTEPNSGGAMETWEQKNFEHLPLVAVTTMMTKMQTDIRNSEADVVSFLRGQIGVNDFRFNKIEAIVLPKSNYVLKGGQYEAEVFIAASDSTEKPEILVGGRALTVKNGRGKYVAGAGAVGERNWGGVIKLTAPDKTVKTYPFKSSYMVGEPSVTVSPTKMNVFYIGVPNPVDILASGVAAEKLKPSITGGNIKKVGGGSYEVRVKKTGKVKVTVMADINGKMTNMGTKEFRVKRVPDPIAKVNKQKGGVISKGVLQAQSGVEADLENFDFNLKFIVQSFTVSATIKGYEEEYRSNSYRFTNQQKQLIGKLRSKARVYISDIKAKGPDGTIRTLPSIAFKLK